MLLWLVFAETRCLTNFVDLNKTQLYKGFESNRKKGDYPGYGDES